MRHVVKSTQHDILHAHMTAASHVLAVWAPACFQATIHSFIRHHTCTDISFCVIDASLSPFAWPYWGQVGPMDTNPFPCEACLTISYSLYSYFTLYRHFPESNSS